ncbi:MAG: hypothetical protein JWP81_5380 [Ferruginibacter sp.]|nr:hypothetical protein [Ferruginibacter sp.]
MKKIIGTSIIILLLVNFSCKKENTAIPPEPVKTISGSWKIIKALRNGTDLTNRFDFSAFRINFSDSTYTIENLVPFIVSKNGKWNFDDPKYPFKISFTAQNSVEKGSTMLYPVVDGVRNIIISFSPGCTLNTYQYTLQKVN